METAPAEVKAQERILRSLTKKLNDIIEELRIVPVSKLDVRSSESAARLRTAVKGLLTLQSEGDEEKHTPKDSMEDSCSSCSTSKESLPDVSRLVFAILFPTLKALARVLHFFAEHAATEGNERTTNDDSKAPPGLLSLVDYTNIQSALELLICWGAVSASFCPPTFCVGKRVFPKTMKISEAVLDCGQAQLLSNTPVESSTSPCQSCSQQRLLTMVIAVYEFVSLPQLKAMLMPRYSRDVLGFVLYTRQEGGDNKTYLRTEADRLLDKVFQDIPLSLVVSSLHQLLSSTAKDSGLRSFRQQCGLLMSECLRKEGGVAAVVDVMCSSLPPGNTQAIMRIADLISSVPEKLSPSDYYLCVGPQLRELLSLKESEGTTAPLSRMAVHIAARMASQHPDLANAAIFRDLLHPLLLFCDPRFLMDADSALPEEDEFDGDALKLRLARRLEQKLAELSPDLPSQIVRRAIESEGAVERALSFLKMVVEATAERSLSQYFLPLLRPLVMLYSKASAMKSHTKAKLDFIIEGLLRVADGSTDILVASLFPNRVVFPLSMYPQAARYTLDKGWAVAWCRMPEVRPGPSGGIILSLNENVTAADAILITKGQHARLISKTGVHEEEGEGQFAVGTMLTSFLKRSELVESPVSGNFFLSILKAVTAYKTGEAVTSTSSITTRGEGDQDTMEAQYHFSQYDCLPRDASEYQQALLLLIELIDMAGPSMLQNAEQVLEILQLSIEASAARFTRTKEEEIGFGSMEDATASGAGEEVDDLLSVALGILTTILEFGAAMNQRLEKEKQFLRRLLPSLETLSEYHSSHVAEMASQLRVMILSGSAVGLSPSGSQEERKPSAVPKTFEETLAEAKTDLASDLVPIRARGVVALTSLVRRTRLSLSEQDKKSAGLIIEINEQEEDGRQSQEETVTRRIESLLGIYEDCLLDQDSYVYLAAVQGLAVLADLLPRKAVPLLISSFKTAEGQLEKQIKMSEALMFTVRRCGDTIGPYAGPLVRVLLDCVRAPRWKDAIIFPINVGKKGQNGPTYHRRRGKRMVEEIKAEPDQEGESQTEKDTNEAEYKPVEEEDPSLTSEAKATGEEDLESPYRKHVAMLRASCLSNLAEVCATLRWGIHNYATDILTCCAGIIDIEREHPVNLPVRRGAVYIIVRVLEALGVGLFEVVPEHLKDVYRILKAAQLSSSDPVTLFHTEKALEELNAIVKDYLLAI